MASLTLSPSVVVPVRSYSRDVAVRRIRHKLWRYISDRAVYLDVPAIVSGLTGLSAAQSQQLLEFRLAVSDLAGTMLDRADELERALASTVGSARRELHGEVEGEVDWPMTVQRRADSGDRTLFVWAPIQRLYDSPKARVLATCLWHYEAIAVRATSAEAEGDDSLASVIQARARRARHIRSRAKLRDVRPLERWPESRLGRFDRREQLRPCLDYLRWVRDGLEGSNLEVVRLVLEAALLAPASNATLFEYEVGFSLVDALEVMGYGTDSLQAIVGDTSPFAQMVGVGGTVRLWRQRSMGSIPGYAAPRGLPYFGAVRAANGLRTSSLRPDWTLEAADRVSPIEVKLSEVSGSSAASTGIIEVMAYRADRPDLSAAGRLGRGAVVAWSAAAQPSATSDIVVASEGTIPDLVRELLRHQAPAAP